MFQVPRNAGLSSIVTEMFDSERYLLRPDVNCSSESKTSSKSKKGIVICVYSAVGHIPTRQAIRETWGSQNTVDGYRIVLVFFVGTTSNIDHQIALRDESMHRADVIQADFKDTYRNLTLKAVSMLRWVSECCPNASYVVKVDDDCFLNIPLLVRELQKLRKKQKVLIGYLFDHRRPHREITHRHYVSFRVYPEEIFPNYLAGSCYIMSTDVAQTMYEECDGNPFMPIEDVFVTAICAKQIGVAPTNNTYFTHHKVPSDGCEYKNRIMGTLLKIEDMKNIWADLIKKANSYKCTDSGSVSMIGMREK